jgi:hypothetical protein
MMADRVDNDRWAKHWSVPADRAAAVREQLQRELYRTWNSPRTTPQTGRIVLFPDHLQRPGQTGMYLLEKMGADLTPLPKDLQQLITATSCQHRIELFPHEGELPGLHYYDGRAMYLGCCAGLGIAGGRYARYEKGSWPGDQINPEERGRAKVWFMVPYGWSHVGLLPVAHEVAGWDWPNEPGTRWLTWADLSELRFAAAMGWGIWVVEKIVWPEARPLDLWAQRLSRLYRQAKENRDEPLAGCYRSIALHTIGRFHNLGFRDARRVVTPGDEAATFENTERVSADGIHIKERVAVEKPPGECHPEWSAAIWAKTHLRVAKALMAVPRESVVGVRGDAIYLTQDAEQTWQPTVRPDAWKDDGSVGQFRLKGKVEGPLPAPRAWRDLEGLTDG